LKVAVRVPDVVTGVPPIVSVEFESESPTDETVAFEVLQVGQVTVKAFPPTIYPAVPLVERGALNVGEEVATF